MKLFRAVSLSEREDIRSQHGRFRDSRNLSSKGFFFEQAAAEEFAKWAAEDDGLQYFIMSCEAPEDLVAQAVKHSAFGEGRGVYFREDELVQLSTAVGVA